jgi:hypothetical protein
MIFSWQKQVLFSKKKQILKKVLKEKKNVKLEAIKSYLKKKTATAGKVLPNYAKEREYERNLKMIAVEGSSRRFIESQSCSTRFKKRRRTTSTRSPRKSRRSSKRERAK